ncbi:MAG: T9SS type A sorting domain-containing protein [Chitinophagales bacterium]|nr:T9SS type A sorting domain-containing protein [Chitinophagales bacterium]
MKKFICIVFVIASSTIFAQDWMPFIPNANHFISHESVYNLNQDSTVIEGDITQYFFNRHFPDPAMEVCFDSIDENGEEYFIIDRCDVIADTFYFYSAATPGFKVKFINPQTLGYSWDVPNTNPVSDWPFVTIAYDSIGVETVFGTEDSVKYFSVNVGVELPDANAIDKVVIKLSKSNGFIQYLNWYRFENPRLIYYYNIELLEGYTVDGMNKGFVVPEWDDYFHYVEGDVLIWKVKFPNGSIDYYIDTVLNIYKDDELVELSTKYYDFTFYKEAYQYVLGGPLCNVMYSPASLNDESFENSGMYSLGFVNNHIDKSGLNPQISKQIYTDRMQEVDNCDYHGMILFGGEGYSFHSFLGLTGFSAKTIGDDLIGFNLIGAIINGVTWGDLTHTEIQPGYSKYNDTFLIQPNPVADIISFPFNNGSFEIYNLNGQLVQQNLFSNSATSVNDLPSGLYTIVVQSNGANYRSVFVKN